MATGKIIKRNGYYGHQNSNGYLINEGYYTAIDAYINALGDTTYCTWILPISNGVPILQTMIGSVVDIRRVVSNVITLPIKPIEEWVGSSFTDYVGTPIIGLRAVDVSTIPFPTSTLKWKCSGSPNYTCSQASDGIYNSKVDCESICKTGATDKKPGMGNTILIVLGAGVGLGVLYYITQKKK